MYGRGPRSAITAFTSLARRPQGLPGSRCPGLMASETGVWEAIIGGPGVEHAHATVRGSPEGAVELAMAMAAEKHGAQDWGWWRFRAE
jgi:hypothetical protein